MGAVIIGGMMMGTFFPLWLLTLAICIWQVSEGCSAIRYGRQLSAEGVLTSGIITDRWTQWIRGKHSCVVYRFEVPVIGASPLLITRAEANPVAYHRCSVGARVLVRYLPTLPRICRLEIDEQMTQQKPPTEGMRS